MPPWFRRRAYLHFDLPIGASRAKSIATSPRQVERHSFYPFIYSIVETIKTTRDPKTKKIQRKKKKREISYACHVDSHIYSYYSWLLMRRYEQEISAKQLAQCVLAFRSLGKSNIDFAYDAFEEIAKRQNCEVIAFDIKGFFDNLDHGILKRAWVALLGKPTLPRDHYAVFRSITRWSRVRKDKLFSSLNISIHNPRPKGLTRRRLCTPSQFRTKVRDAALIEVNNQSHGIPQGSPISAVLSNIYMMSFDEKISSFAKSIDARYMRYCDDMIVIAPNGNAKAIKNFVDTQIAEVKLEIQTEKTEERQFSMSSDGIIRADKPLQYLGFTFDGCQVHIRPSSMAHYFEKMRMGVKVALKATKKRNQARLSRGQTPKPLHLKQLFRRYSYLGRRNFISYGQRSALKMSSVNPTSIKHQLTPLWAKFQKAIGP
jgi:RNA-directed DNA polymerase